MGQGYSTIAWIPETEGSWVLPIRHERITSFETRISKAVWQIKQVSKQFNKRILALLYSEYGKASSVNKTKDIEVDCLIRIRSNCCLWGEPEKSSGRGRPKKPGDKFKLNDSTTWWNADKTVKVEDQKLGDIKISQWSNLPFRNSSDIGMNLILVEGICSEKKGSLQKPLWLIWIGGEMPPLELIWTKYLRRFTVDH